VALQGKGRIGRRSDGKCFLYLPKSVVEDSAFPFDAYSSVDVTVLIDADGERILVLPLNKAQRPRRKRGAERSR
jgi:hypothetical protein